MVNGSVKLLAWSKNIVAFSVVDESTISEDKDKSESWVSDAKAKTKSQHSRPRPRQRPRPNTHVNKP